MDSRDAKKVQVYRQHASGVSRALWPTEVRCKIATGRAAQRRRSMVMSGKWWAFVAKLYQWSIASVFVAALMLAGGAIVAALVLHLWYVLILPTIILIVMTLVIAPLLLAKLRLFFRFFSARRPARTSAFFPMAHRAPETPMPSLPLIRVLETVDLSSSNVEHFLEATKEKEQTPMTFR